jgi:hypothetical protein
MEEKFLSLSTKQQIETCRHYLFSLGYIDSDNKAYTKNGQYYFKSFSKSRFFDIVHFYRLDAVTHVKMPLTIFDQDIVAKVAFKLYQTQKFIKLTSAVKNKLIEAAFIEIFGKKFKYQNTIVTFTGFMIFY